MGVVGLSGIYSARTDLRIAGLGLPVAEKTYLF